MLIAKKCYDEYGPDLDGCSRQQHQGCAGCYWLLDNPVDSVPVEMPAKISVITPVNNTMVEFETNDGNKGVLGELILADEAAALCEVMGCNDNDFIDAMVIITNEFKRDKSPGSVYFGWQSNLACCIYDGLKNDNEDLTMSQCNDIAIKFLNRLIGDN